MRNRVRKAASSSIVRCIRSRREERTATPAKKHESGRLTYGNDIRLKTACEGARMNSRHEVSENHTHRQEQDLLYQLAHDLARSPDVRTIANCDYSHTTLWQPTEDAYVVVAGYGETSEQAEARRAFKMPRMMLAPLLTRLAKEEVIEFETEASRDSVTKSLMQKLHLTTTLWVPLWRGTEIIGMQSASRRGSLTHHLRALPPGRQLPHAPPRRCRVGTVYRAAVVEFAGRHGGG